MQLTTVVSLRSRNMLPVPTVFVEPDVLEWQSDDDSVGFRVYDGSVDTDEIYNEANAPQGLDSGETHFILSVAWGGPVETTSFDVTLGRQHNYDSSGTLLRNRIDTTDNSSIISNGTNSFARYDFSTSVTEVGISHFQFGGSAGQQGTTLGATILVMNKDALGVQDQDFFSRGSPNVAQTNNTTIATDYTSQPESLSTEEYIILTGYRCLFPSSGDLTEDRRMQFYNTMDDVDLHSVETGNTTGGATDPGRGFSFTWAAQGATWQSMSSTVRTLPKGTRNFQQIARRQGASEVADRMGSLSLIIRRAMFQNSDIKKVTTAVQSDPGNTWTATDFEVSLTSANKVLVIFTTSVMPLSSSHMPVFRIVDSNDNRVFGGSSFSTGLSCYTWNNPYSSLDTPSSDADCVPFFLCAVFDNPGTETWKIEYTKRDNGLSNSQEILWNCRDDGTSGFEGYMMALELMLATDT